MCPIISLRQLKSGQSATVIKISTSGPIGRRLRDMGLIPGTTLTVIGRAPLKDPVEIKIKNYNLTLRNKEADYIIVETNQKIYKQAFI